MQIEYCLAVHKNTCKHSLELVRVEKQITEIWVNLVIFSLPHMKLSMQIEYCLAVNKNTCKHSLELVGVEKQITEIWINFAIFSLPHMKL